LVGGSAFLLDSGLLYIFKEHVFYNLDTLGIYISIALGSTGGLIYNYILSLAFVFRGEDERKRNVGANTFFSFAAVGIVGLLLTEWGLYVGVEKLGFHYLSVKAMMAAVVLIWNYVGRKVLLFKYN
jgi:putative flippase GtrA